MESPIRVSRRNLRASDVDSSLSSSNHSLPPKKNPTWSNSAVLSKVGSKADLAEEDGIVTKLFAFLGEWDRKTVGYLTALALIVRLILLHHPSVVVFDEVHFGGFAQKYLKREFFSDLHPPLARLLVTLAAWVGGFDANFSFYDIGADYLLPQVPYITMRAFSAVLGVAVVPMAFVTMRAMCLQPHTSAAVSLMLLFGNKSLSEFR